LGKNSNFYSEYFKWRTGNGEGYTKYHCIFDEATSCLDITKPHEHKVLQSWEIKGPRGHIAKGIAIQTEAGWKWGCLKKYLS
jgi:hypothetical protein